MGTEWISTGLSAGLSSQLQYQTNADPSGVRFLNVDSADEVVLSGWGAAFAIPPFARRHEEWGILILLIDSVGLLGYRSFPHLKSEIRGTLITQSR